MSGPSPRPPRAAFGKLLLNEARMAWRVPFGLLLGLGFPLLLLVIFGSSPKLTRPIPGLGGQSYFQASFPVLVGWTILALSCLVLPQTLVRYREMGVLRRLSVTPVPPTWLLAAQVVLNIGLAAVGMALLLIVGRAAFGLALPKDIPGFWLVILLTITALFAIGLCMASVISNSAAARAIGGLFFYAMLFFAGLWVPREMMSMPLREISDWTPLGASMAGIQNAMTGSFPPLQSLLLLAADAVVFGYLAVHYFRWE
ncbi:MAG: ABC transporter permease [Armatimonadetes bacterium]|nr:ABC transporter permease [Armatimonadota bacterium]